MKKTLLSIVLICLVGCAEPERPQETKKNTISLPSENTDVRIMQARNYVVEYDDRMDRAMKIIDKCSDQNFLSGDDAIQNCKRMAYNATGFEYGAYSCFSCVEITPSIIEEYNEMRKRAALPLSTEM